MKNETADKDSRISKLFGINSTARITSKTKMASGGGKTPQVNRLGFSYFRIKLNKKPI